MMSLAPHFAAVALAAVCLAACASIDATPATQVGAITYEVKSLGPFCFARCKFIKLTALPSGRVWVERRVRTGNSRAPRIEQQLLRVRTEQFIAFRARLEVYRPSGKLARGGPDSCASYTDDLPEVAIAWRGIDGEDQLTFNFGCDMDVTANVRDALRSAPSLLGIRAQF